MSIHRFTIDIEVDDEVLEDHVENADGTRAPYDTDPAEWDGTDIFSAADEGVLDIGETVLVSYEKRPEPS